MKLWVPCPATELPCFVLFEVDFVLSSFGIALVAFLTKVVNSEHSVVFPFSFCLLREDRRSVQAVCCLFADSQLRSEQRRDAELRPLIRSSGWVRAQHSPHMGVYMDFTVLTCLPLPQDSPRFPAVLSGASVILKNSVRKVFFGFMLAVRLMSKWSVCGVWPHK